MAAGGIPANCIDLLDQTVGCLMSIHGLAPIEQVVVPANVLIQKATSLLTGVEDVGESNVLRQSIYSLVQSQKGNGNCAFYRSLQCPLHLDLLGDNGPPTTLPCGHSYCIGCITGVINLAPHLRLCPTCRAPIRVAIADLRINSVIGDITDRLRPRPAAGGYRKNKSSTSRRNRRR